MAMAHQQNCHAREALLRRHVILLCKDLTVTALYLWVYYFQLSYGLSA